VPKNAGTMLEPVSLSTIHYYHANIDSLAMSADGAWFNYTEHYYGRPVGSQNAPFAVPSHIENGTNWEFWYSPNGKPGGTTEPDFTLNLVPETTPHSS
jgi:hypothetical protein